MRIDYLKISTALTVYQAMGYRPIEVPWIVRPDIAEMTLPLDAQAMCVSKGGEFDLGNLVGSAEQGFLEIRDTLLPNVRYVAASPCFRDEPEYEPGVKQTWFFKVELIHVAPSNPKQALNSMIEAARQTMRTWGAKPGTVDTAEGIDLIVNDIEVGSYGYREVDGFSWVYGTGLAEPRFTTALRRKAGVVSKLGE